VERVLTIGVYGWTVDSWLEAIQTAGCDAVVDIRARRGVRSREFAWANRQRLQAVLDAAGIRYLHRPELAPTREIRTAQKRADTDSRTRKRDRTELASTFADLYTLGVANNVNWQELAAGLDALRPALLCVERSSAACHRTIAAERLAAAGGVAIVHLVPV
jgi:uncharacterized protein (DUF488 family)